MNSHNTQLKLNNFTLLVFILIKSHTVMVVVVVVVLPDRF